MVSTSKFKYVLRCKSCSSDLASPKTFCKKCKVTGPSYFVTQHQNDKPDCLCQKCHSKLHTYHVPNFCYSCGSIDFDWWDVDSEDWIATEITLNQQKKAIWLIGEFNGDFVGDLIDIGLPIDVELLKNYPRKYDVTITAGLLSNYIVTDKSPKLVFNNNPKPIRQEYIKSILVKSLETDEYLPINLVDLVIFDWHKIADKELFDQRKITGHLYGKLCGCIVKDEEFEEIIARDVQTEEQDNQSSTTSAPPKGPASPSHIKNPSNEGISTQKTPIAPVQPEAMPAPQNENHTFSPPVEKYDYGCLICNGFFQFIFTFFTFFVFQSTNLSLNFWDVFLCHLFQAVIFYLSLKGLCALIKYVKDKNLYLKNLVNDQILGNLLILIAIFCLIVVITNNIGIKCFDIKTFNIWPFIILLALLLSAFIRSCLKKFILAVIFVFTLCVCISCDKHTCTTSDKRINTSIEHQIYNTQKQVKGLVEEHKANVAEDKVKELTSLSNSSHKITVEDLKNNPDALNDCESSLYLGELSIFDRSSAIIKETAESKLNDLAEVLSQHSKDTKYIITGHADQTGELFPDGQPNPIGYANNIKLSKQRAMAVGEWLISHQVINKERLDIRGVGSSEPLTTDPDKELQKLNIRVEISLDCLKVN